MEQLTLGVGTRLQHTQYGPGVIVGVRLATYLISFINYGVKEIDKTDPKLEEIIPENVTVELETISEVEKSLLKILRLWSDASEIVPLGERWLGGTMILQPTMRDTIRLRRCTIRLVSLVSLWSTLRRLVSVIAKIPIYCHPNFRPTTHVWLTF